MRKFETLQELVDRLGLKPNENEIKIGRTKSNNGFSRVIVDKVTNTYVTVDVDNWYYDYIVRG